MQIAEFLCVRFRKKNSVWKFDSSFSWIRIKISLWNFSIFIGKFGKIIARFILVDVVRRDLNLPIKLCMPDRLKVNYCHASWHHKHGISVHLIDPYAAQRVNAVIFWTCTSDRARLLCGQFFACQCQTVSLSPVVCSSFCCLFVRFAFVFDSVSVMCRGMGNE